MMHRVISKQESGTITLLEIYRKANTHAVRSKAATNSLRVASAKEMEAASCVLEWLGMITRDKGAAFGLKPTDLLLDVINRSPKPRLRSRKEYASREDEDAVDLILDAALGKSNRANVVGFVFDVLGVLGLVRYTVNNSTMPTRRLREMAVDRRWNDRQVEREYRLRRSKKSK